jgi:UDP-N-acetyl-D-glucosamine dehydrogenase
VLRPLLVGAGFRVVVDIFLVYVPEREDSGNREFTTRTTQKVCGRGMDACMGLVESAAEFYPEVQFGSAAPCTSTETYSAWYRASTWAGG